jgi:glutamate-1-semialdehyde 2,1-aminomutase
MATFNIQTVPGITAGVSNDTLTAPYNDLAAVKQLVAAHKNEIAAIIIEPVAGNMGCILSAPGFLEGLRVICDEKDIVFIFDEVMTGFRLSAGGAQEKLGIDADLITYGKVIGAGMPVGAFGGKRKIMEHIAPLGNVYQAGTLSGNPVAMIAGYTLLNELKNNPAIYAALGTKGIYLRDHFEQALKDSGKPYVINHLGSMISIHFSEQPVTDLVLLPHAISRCSINFFTTCWITAFTCPHLHMKAGS